MNRKSLKINALLSTIKTISNAIFPLITYPYIARILTVEGMGKISFSQSVVNYFILIAGFGIYHFAVKNGAGIRDEKFEFNLFANSIFTINCIAALFSFFLLLIVLLFSTRLTDYRGMILIYSISIVLNPFSVEWLYTVYEDFGYITVRSICIQILSLLLTFLFIREKDDIYVYCAFLVASTSLGNLFNFIYSRKYVALKLTRETRWKKYKASLFVFLINSLATIIYLNSDTTLLGFICSDREVGLYSVASKIYSITKQIFNAVVAVAIPRLAYLKGKDANKFTFLIRTMVSMATFFVFPAAFGIIIVRDELILFIAGREYIAASDTLAILSFAIICAVFANIFANGLLLCLGLERFVLKTTTISALINLFLNLLFIPIFSEIGAALTTVVAEMVVVIMALYYSRKKVKGLFNINSIMKSIMGCVIMSIVSVPVGTLLTDTNYIVRLFVIFFVCVFVYLIVELILKNEIVLKKKADY